MARQKATDDLIAELAVDAQVRRLWPPALRAGLWLALVFGGLIAVVLVKTTRPGFESALAESGGWFSCAAGVATAITAAMAAFHLSIPGESRKWLLLPLPFGLLWLACMGLGCYGDLVVRGGQISWLDGNECFRDILMTSLIIGVPLVFMLRYARFIRPVETAAMAGLSASAVCAVALEFIHEHEAHAMDIAWHLVAMSIVILFWTVSAAAIRRMARPSV